MGRKNKGKKGKNKDSGRHHSTLAEHKLVGRTLQPPMAQFPMNFSSWSNERFPEMLWAALLFTQFDRRLAIEVVRELTTNHVQKAPHDFPDDVTISGLAEADKEKAARVLGFICGNDLAKEIMRPLLLFPDLPGIDRWREAIGVDPSEQDWDNLTATVAQTLDHQSEASTDCRWASLAYVLGKGRIKFVQKTADMASTIALYPYFGGEERAAQGVIRAAEQQIMSIQRKNLSWTSSFWAFCMKETECWALIQVFPSTVPALGTTRETTYRIFDELAEHCNATRSTTGVDPRHDTVFGVGLYSLALLTELFGLTTATSIHSRLILRSIVECYVSLAYLLTKDSPELWRSYRVFGAGQAKLTSLKLEEMADKPTSVDEQTLRRLANEDMWQEFVSIDLGHWEQSNLRKLAIDADVKEDYDRFYSWASVYSHGHWSAIRDSVFDTCGNPLHRLHRIPRRTARPLPDVVEDAARLVDKVLALVSKAYPGFNARLTTD